MGTKGKDFSGQVPPSVIDTEYEGCDFTQPSYLPGGGGVVIFGTDRTPRKFTRCSLINVEVPSGSVLVDCLFDPTLKNFTKDGVTPRIVAMVYRRCNFGQPQPVDKGAGVFEGVRLFPGDDTPRTFVRCNLVNCEVPPGSTVVKGNTAIVERGLIKTVNTIKVDGESFDVTTRINRVHGRWTAEGYDHKPIPEDIVQ